ncbi:MAG: DUF3168 domain-containing protein [Pseudomonadota bacterium]
MSVIQAFIYNSLTTAPAVIDLVGDAVYDAAPQGGLPDLAVMIGAEEVLDASDILASARLHRAEIELVGRGAGFSTMKNAADAIRACLESDTGPAGDGAITRVRFHRAQSLRETSDGLRRIRMRFDIFFDGI